MIHFLQGTNPAYPPQNPVYPPTNPTMMPPNQFPQWNGPPPGQYPPGPAAPMVMLNSMCLEERNTGPLTFKLHSVYGQPIVNWPWGGRGAGFFLNVCIQHVCGWKQGKGYWPVFVFVLVLNAWLSHVLCVWRATWLPRSCTTPHQTVIRPKKRFKWRIWLLYLPTLCWLPLRRYLNTHSYFLLIKIIKFENQLLFLPSFLFLIFHCLV